MKMNRLQIKERVKEILCSQLGLDYNEVKDDSLLKDDLDAEEIDIFDIIMDLEDNFDIEISWDDMNEDGDYTVDEVVDIVLKS
jgi:acyl carrier protein